MLKSRTKTAMAVIGSSFVSFTAVFADQPMESAQSTEMPAYVPGEIIKGDQLPAGYSASSSYKCANGWDLFVTGDYIYWAWQQDSFKVGALVSRSEEVGATGSVIYADPGYTSGFQVELGFNMPGMDDWNLYSEYTWYKNSDTTSLSSDASREILREDSIIPNKNHYFDGTITSTFKLNFDALDFLVKRPFYFGKKVTASLGTGLAALWVTQTFKANRNGFSGKGVPVVGVVSQKQTSWGLGPKLGFETNWMVGYGLQVMANLSASFLYARYEVNSKSSVTKSGVYKSASVVELDGYGTLRPVMESFLGLGWGTGFFHDKYRVMLSAGYDFNVYWNYNMRNYAVTNVGGNMYLQGLNVGARFDF